MTKRIVFYIIAIAVFSVDSTGLLPAILPSAPVLKTAANAPLKTVPAENFKSNVSIIMDRERSMLRDDPQGRFVAGIEAYRAGHMQQAAQFFTALLKEDDDLIASDRAACGFWAYRALSAAGDKQHAMQYAVQAANESPGFYSILSRYVVGQATANVNAVEPALYPIPQWKPTAGYRIDPSLLFAIMRRESGFNPNARSAAGALGVMQLMPATAHAMARAERISGHSREPSFSMTLGQSYLEHLMDISFIGDNLIFLAAAYNAGPGNVSHWQDSIAYHEDPLLFVESIPFRETRQYVTSVIGNYWVYSQLLGSEAPSARALAQGKWPHYVGSDEQLASIQMRLTSARIE